MLKQSNPPLIRRLAGGALIAVLAAGAGYTAWASAPATIPAIEIPLAYFEEAMTLEPAWMPEVPVGAALEPQPDLAPEPQATPQIDPMDVTADGRPFYGQPFVRRYDGGSPVLINGVVVRTDLLNPNAAMWVYGHGTDNSGTDLGEQLWRVDGGTYLTLSPEQRASLTDLAGQQITVRGYSTKDKACSPTCRVNGRDLTLADGRPFLAGVGGTGPCTFEEVRAYTCPGSDKVSPVPTPPTEAEIKAALARAGRAQGEIILRSPLSNSVKRE